MTAVNQCDGCRAGHPLVDGVHKPVGSEPWDGSAMVLAARDAERAEMVALLEEWSGATPRLGSLPARTETLLAKLRGSP